MLAMRNSAKDYYKLIENVKAITFNVTVAFGTASGAFHVPSTHVAVLW